jgi:hypothetical protein
MAARAIKIRGDAWLWANPYGSNREFSRAEQGEVSREQGIKLTLRHQNSKGKLDELGINKPQFCDCVNI